MTAAPTSLFLTEPPDQLAAVLKGWDPISGKFVTVQVDAAGNILAGGNNYQTVAAGVTDQALGATGAAGDYVGVIWIFPAATNCGAVSIKDGSGSSFTLFPGGGTTALTTLIPFPVALCSKSSSGAWKITTGTNVSVWAQGSFTA